jgi:hypothetical protein
VDVDPRERSEMSFKKWLLAGAMVPALLAGVTAAVAQPEIGRAHV